MSQEQERQFTDLVLGSLPPSEPALLGLWRPIAEEFNRGGPDVARQYLEDRQTALQGTIQNLLSEFEED